ncbi:MAG: hypothetical protein KF858_04650 [Candidatus Sumerlaeia bacterium]|nr:hypothetical protein [Candidatus Sumerlaeia bacterium]
MTYTIMLEEFGKRLLVHDGVGWMLLNAAILTACLAGVACVLAAVGLGVSCGMHRAALMFGVLMLIQLGCQRLRLPVYSRLGLESILTAAAFVPVFLA